MEQDICVQSMELVVYKRGSKTTIRVESWENHVMNQEV